MATIIETRLTKQTMQAARYKQQGSAREVIQCGEMQIPKPDVNKVRVKVYASGIRGCMESCLALSG